MKDDETSNHFYKTFIMNVRLMDPLLRHRFTGIAMAEVDDTLRGMRDAIRALTMLRERGA